MFFETCKHITLILLSHRNNRRSEPQGMYFHIFSLSACHICATFQSLSGALSLELPMQLVMWHFSVAFHSMDPCSVLTLNCQDIMPYKQIPPRQNSHFCLQFKSAVSSVGHRAWSGSKEGKREINMKSIILYSAQLE